MERAQRDAEPRAAEHEHYGRRCAGKQHGSAQGRESSEKQIKLRNEAVIDDVPGKESAAHKSQAHEQEIEAGVVGKAVFSGEHGKVVGNHALHKRGDEQREKGGRAPSFMKNMSGESFFCRMTILLSRGAGAVETRLPQTRIPPEPRRRGIGKGGRREAEHGAENHAERHGAAEKMPMPVPILPSGMKSTASVACEVVMEGKDQGRA